MISRDHAWVDREYGEEKWPAMLRAIAEIAAGRPSLLAALRDAVTAWVGGAEGRAEVIPVVLGGIRLPLPRGVVVDTQKRRVDRTIANHRDALDASLVVELGSGWGHNILDLAARDSSPDRYYVGAEYTEAGRDAADVLASLDPDLRYRSMSFDYHDPDLSMLEGHESAVVFTVHSVEQIPQLDESVVHEILGLARRVTCVHFEPVGWQYGPSSGSSEIHARRHGYNRNLAELLAECERRGLIAVQRRTVDLIGVNPANATTMVIWRSRTRRRFATPQPLRP